MTLNAAGRGPEPIPLPPPVAPLATAARLWRALSPARSPHVWLLAPSLLVMVLFFLMPFLLTFYESLLVKGQLSAANYVRFLSDLYYLRVLLQTLGLAVVVTLLAVVLGYPCAYIVARSHVSLRAVLLFAIISPLMIGVVIRSLGWMVFLGGSGPVNELLLQAGIIQRPLRLLHNWTAVIVGSVHVFTPYLILAVASVLERLDLGIEDSARVLGATRWQTFLQVTLPLSLEGVVAGATIVFTFTLAGFAIVLLLGGTDTMVLSVAIYQEMITTLDYGFARALAAALLTIAGIVMYLGTRFGKVRGGSS